MKSHVSGGRVHFNVDDRVELQKPDPEYSRISCRLSSYLLPWLSLLRNCITRKFDVSSHIKWVEGWLKIFFTCSVHCIYTKMGFLLLQKIMRNAYYFTVVILLEKHGVSVSEKNLVPSFNVIVFKVDGLDRERSWTCYKLSFIFGHFLEVAFFTKQKTIRYLSYLLH